MKLWFTHLETKWQTIKWHFRGSFQSVNVAGQKRGDKYINQKKSPTKTYKNILRWSTCVLVYFSWLLDHVIYLKLRRECLLCQAMQIHKLTTKTTQNDFVLCTSRTILSCHFVKLFSFTQQSISSQLDSWNHSQHCFFGICHYSFTPQLSNSGLGFLFRIDYSFNNPCRQKIEKRIYASQPYRIDSRNSYCLFHYNSYFNYRRLEPPLCIYLWNARYYGHDTTRNFWELHFAFTWSVQRYSWQH